MDLHQNKSLKKTIAAARGARSLSRPAPRANKVRGIARIRRRRCVRCGRAAPGGFSVGRESVGNQRALERAKGTEPSTRTLARCCALPRYTRIAETGGHRGRRRADLCQMRPDNATGRIGFRSRPSNRAEALAGASEFRRPRRRAALKIP